MKKYNVKFHMIDGHVEERTYESDGIAHELDNIVVSKRTTFVDEVNNIMYPHTSVVKISYEES